MTESSNASDTPAKPQDYAGLRTELATLVNDFAPLINELWPRLEGHKYRWQLHTYGLVEGYNMAGGLTDLLVTPASRMALMLAPEPVMTFRIIESSSHVTYFAHALPASSACF